MKREINISYYENIIKEETIMGLTRKILNWTDRKFDEVIDNIENEKHPTIKSGMLGGIEGIIDGAVISYPILIVTCIIAAKKLSKLEE